MAEKKSKGKGYGERSGEALLDKYWREIKFNQPLKRGEELKMIARAKAGDQQARQRVIEANLRFVVDVARRYLPALNDQNGTQWMGHRPTTPDSIPVICTSPRVANLHYAFGHGHYGLTMAPTTGKAIASLVLGEVPNIDLSPFGISRFA